ncbi:MAG TPA: hypothetical protein VKE74_01140 [Gemmataceae bacterium]|nr:hypothetical protein [Gemmataceae bacterium]
MTTTDNDVQIAAEPAGKTTFKVTVSLDGNVLYVDTLNPSNAAARKKFADSVTARFSGLDANLLDAELVKLAAGGAAPAAPDDHPQEVDVSRVVRPELFHTIDVSGITVPVLLDAAGELVPRWQTHLRWADGRREVIATPDRLKLPGGSPLYVRPDPGEPPDSDPPAWSADSRRDWLAGADAPDPGRVFQNVCSLIAQYLEFPPEAAAGTTATLALWAVFTYLYPAWDAVPYLSLGGPMASGKTRVLDVLQRLAFRPVSSSNLTAPALFRILHAYGGVMLYDEAERLRQSTPDVQELNSVFLAGYKRGGTAIRLEPVGDAFRPVRFNVYGPKALACIAGLPPTLASRCVRIIMFRAAADSPKPKRRIDADPAAWQSVRDDLHVLALEYGPRWVRLASCKDVVPAGLGGRHFELWQPLLALAHWFQDHGAENLLGLVQTHALASVATAADDAVPEADEVLLELLAEAVRDHRPPTSKELLESAKLRDEATFRTWQSGWVTGRLKNYGISTPKKTNGERRYRHVTPAQLIQIGERYGLDLGLA